MKQLTLLLIHAYQTLLSPVFQTLLGAPMCRHSISCSAYAKIAIEEKGVMKGLHLSLRRFLSCQPFGSAV